MNKNLEFSSSVALNEELYTMRNIGEVQWELPLKCPVFSQWLHCRERKVKTQQLDCRDETKSEHTVGAQDRASSAWNKWKCVV